MKNAKSSIVKLTPERLEELSRDPRNLVYRHGDRERLAPEQVVPTDIVLDRINRLFALVEDHRRRFRERKLPITELRWKYIKQEALKVPEWKAFSDTHPTTFDRVMHPKTTPKEIEALRFMIFLFDKEKRGEIPAGKGKEVLQTYILKTFSTTKAEYKRQIKEEGFITAEESARSGGPPPAPAADRGHIHEMR